jgi:hypothetical protein
MHSTMQATWLVVGGLTLLFGCGSTPPTQPNPKEMTFFVTSVGPGRGGDLGGLEGADRHCESLARRRVPGIAPGVPT